MCREVAHTLVQLREGSHHVFDDAIRFCTLAAESQQNNEALANMFYLSLSEEIKDRLATINLLSSFEDLLELVIKVDNHLQLW